MLIVDIVESVRLIETDQNTAVAHWRRIVAHTEEVLLPGKRARLVKSLGDGLLIEAQSVADALPIAFGIRAIAKTLNTDLPEDRKLHLRQGLDLGELLVDEHDVYGHNVNIAARLCALGDPGEIIVSAAVRDQIVNGVDADIVDLSECFLKHVKKPVRAYRLSPVAETGQRIRLPVLAKPLLPTIAVIPLRTLGAPACQSGATGQILAEELIRAFGQSPHLNVISRLSTAPFVASDKSLDEIADLLDASHVMTGTVVEDGVTLHLSLDLTEVRSKQVIWSERCKENVTDLLMGDQDVIARIAGEVGKAVLSRELQRARALPVRTVESYTLMLAAINAMYRLSLTDFNYASAMLEATIERNPRHSAPLAWMGNWHVLKVQQGWTDDPTREQRLAEDRTARALDLNPDCEQALTIDGLVQTNLSKDFEHAEAQYSRALSFNPNSALANLLKGTMHAFRDEGDEAIRFSETAQSKSPFDPQQYYFDCLTAAAYIAANKPAEALPFAERSLRANATHTSTLRTLAVAQWQTGDQAAARDTIASMVALEPELTVTKWERQNPAANYKMGKKIAEILRAAGVPS
ncbi:adenylate/guanylate cyclase domain-containing protein [Oceanibium sediminis]|uniref:adenylate/guanylate cyclase domain-containing protein n=1 Tax=Oceanibium sediminis TaxID=2026339 RepID=UPI001300B6F8|nr:adenylate/guanylate cyclase domain-containing protein [Oceanibium sediminis]